MNHPNTYRHNPQWASFQMSTLQNPDLQIPNERKLCSIHSAFTRRNLCHTFKKKFFGTLIIWLVLFFFFFVFFFSIKKKGWQVGGHYISKTLERRRSTCHPWLRHWNVHKKVMCLILLWILWSCEINVPSADIMVNPKIPHLSPDDACLTFQVIQQFKNVSCL